MYLCLSSGASERYLHDVLRAIGMPDGSYLQFRYDQRWIMLEVKDKLTATPKPDGRVLVCYIDQTDTSKKPVIVPCRFAQLANIVRQGSSFILRLSLGNLAHSEDVTGFNGKLIESLGDVLPHFEVGTGKFTGCYWFEVDDAFFNSLSVRESDNSNKWEVWESLVRDLSQCSEFAGVEFYYNVDGIFDLNCLKPVPGKKGFFVLSPGREYQLRLYHFNPIRTPQGKAIEVSCPTESIIAESNEILWVDSRYDMKYFNFRTAIPSGAEKSFISLSKSSPPDTNTRKWDFDIHLKIKGAIWRKLGFGFLVGVALALPTIISAFLNTSASETDKTIVSGAALIFGIIAGLAAAFGFKRSL